jgi:hypothetical protein
MSEEHKNKKSNKWLLPVVIIAVLLVVALVYLGSFSMPAGLAAVGANAQNNQPPAFTTTGNELVAKEITQNLPYYEMVNLESGRYTMQVITDNPVWIRLYDQTQFDKWQSTGKHGSVKSGTNMGTNDKVTNFGGTFDINNGEEGKYYLLIMGSGSTSIKFKITQNAKF